MANSSLVKLLTMKNKINDYNLEKITYSLDDGNTIDLSDISIDEFSTYTSDIASMWPSSMSTDDIIITSDQSQTVTVDSTWAASDWNNNIIDIDLGIMDKTPVDQVEHAELKLSGVCPACRCKLPDHEWNCVKSYQSVNVTVDSNDDNYLYFDENDMWTDVTQFTTMNTQNDK